MNIINQKIKKIKNNHMWSNKITKPVGIHKIPSLIIAYKVGDGSACGQRERHNMNANAGPKAGTPLWCF